MQYSNTKKLQSQVVSSFSKERQVSIQKTCELLGISRQSYYRSFWDEKEKEQVATQVIRLVENIRQRMPKIGVRKLYHILQSELEELGVGRDKLFRILRNNRLLIRPKRSYHKTTNSYHRFKKHKNLVENLEISKAEQVWVSDITYIGTRENPMYLALVTDAYSKKIVGYDVSSSLETVGCSRALQMALKKRNYPERSLIHHSDRGIQYCSYEYQKILQKNKVTCSMTQEHDPYENAVAERVNGILKQEFLIASENTYVEWVKKMIGQSVKIYNTERPHFSLYMQTPEQTHVKENIKIRTYKKQKSDYQKTV